MFDERSDIATAYHVQLIAPPARSAHAFRGIDPKSRMPARSVAAGELAFEPVLNLYSGIARCSMLPVPKCTLTSSIDASHVALHNRLTDLLVKYMS
jgi:hypothetical protein